MAGGKFVGWLVDGIPTLFKFLKNRKRANDVEKIDNAIASNNDKFIHDKLSKVVQDEDKRRKANS